MARELIKMADESPERVKGREIGWHRAGFLNGQLLANFLKPMGVQKPIP